MTWTSETSLVDPVMASGIPYLNLHKKNYLDIIKTKIYLWIILIIKQYREFRQSEHKSLRIKRERKGFSDKRIGQRSKNKDMARRIRSGDRNYIQ